MCMQLDRPNIFVRAIELFILNPFRLHDSAG